MPQKQYAVFVPTSVVFPGTNPDLKTLRSLLEGLSRMDTLFWCARLNLVLSNTEMEPFERQKYCIQRFLSPDELSRTFGFAGKEESGGKTVIVFSRGQLLELMRWTALFCEDLPGDGETFCDPEVRRRFAKAALICSEIVNARIWRTDCIDDTAHAVVQGNAPNLPMKSAMAIASADLYSCLGRGWTLFRDYLPKYYPSFNDDFLSATGLSILAYFACLSMILAAATGPNDDPGFTYNSVLQKTPYNAAFQRYMTLKSQTADELQERWLDRFPRDLRSLEAAPPFSKRPLLEKPILRREHTQAIILDPLCFGESAIAGPLFHVLEASPSKAQDLCAAFGQAFEDYVQDILRRMFPSSPALVDRLHTNKEVFEFGGSRLDADACIIDLEKAVLFEAKALWMREGEMLNSDDEAFIAYFRGLYVEPKGIGQLARMVTAISDPRQPKANPEFSEATLIYPVMIVNDPLLDTPFVGRFLQHEFHDCLVPDATLSSGRMVKGRLKVTPVIMLDIKALEGLEASVRHQGFLDILDDYATNCDRGAVPFGNYIISSPKYGGDFNPRFSIASKAMEALKAAAQEVFPEADLSQC